MKREIEGDRGKEGLRLALYTAQGVPVSSCGLTENADKLKVPNRSPCGELTGAFVYSRRALCMTYRSVSGTTALMNFQQPLT
jgi:hypothetical protein